MTNRGWYHLTLPKVKNMFHQLIDTSFATEQSLVFARESMRVLGHRCVPLAHKIAILSATSRVPNARFQIIAFSDIRDIQLGHDLF